MQALSFIVFFRTHVQNFFAVELAFNVLVEERTRRTLTLNIQLKHLPQTERHIIITINVSAAEFNVQTLFGFVVIYLVYGG